MKQDQLFVRVFTMDRILIDRGWNARDVCSGFWRLYRNEGAGAALELPGGELYALAAGRLHLVPAWVPFSCRNTRPIVHRYVHFDVIGVTAATIRRLFTRPLTLASDRPLDAMAATLGEVQAGEEAARFHAKSVIYGALALAVAALPPGAFGGIAHAGPVAAAVAYIDGHLGQGIRNRELAACCHLSADHFGRVFRARMGMTPARYVVERRIAAATQELVFTQDSIERVAARLGFANRYHLTRVFTRRMGIPPAAYRRKARV